MRCVCLYIYLLLDRIRSDQKYNNQKFPGAKSHVRELKSVNEKRKYKYRIVDNNEYMSY